MTRTKEAERSLPANLEAERAVLGAVLLHNEALIPLLGELAPDDFFRDAHRRIFKAMIALQERGAAIDLVTLRHGLAQQGDVDEAGGPAYITGLVDGLPVHANVSHYAAIVREQSRLRQAIYEGNRLLTQAYEGEDQAVNVLTAAAERLFALGGQSAPQKPVLVGDMLAESLDAIEQAHRGRRGLGLGISTGFYDLDGLLSGLQPSDLIIVAALTSAGKTALALGMARHVAAERTVLIFSLEMSRLQLVLRLVASEGRVDSHRIRSGYLGDADWTKLSQAMSSLADLRLLIDDASTLTVADVHARARQVQHDHGLGMIVIDYLQLMQGAGRAENRAQEVASISKGLKGIAKKLNVPVVALSQLTRVPAGRGHAKAVRPQLSSLKESSALEQDADVVLMIYRPDHDDDDETPPKVEIIVAKQRNGPTGTIKLTFIKEYVRFENIIETTTTPTQGRGEDKW